MHIIVPNLHIKQLKIPKYANVFESLVYFSKITLTLITRMLWGCCYLFG